MPTMAERRSMKDYSTDAAPWWCPGCGDFGVLRALQMAAAQLNLDPAHTVLVAGIGCSGKIGDYFRSYSIHVIHGRTMPIATGIKLANRDLTVIVAGGDGDGFGIGLGHFFHAARRNLDVTYVVMDNGIYGLTKGQFSPTSPQGFETSSSPTGTAERPVRPLRLAMVAGVSYLAQAFSGNPKQMAELIAGGIRHRGFALINCFSPCVTYNKLNTYGWFKKNLHELEDGERDPSDWQAAFNRLVEADDLLTGLIYRNPEAPPYDALIPGFREQPIVAERLAREPSEWRRVLAEFS